MVIALCIATVGLLATLSRPMLAEAAQATYFYIRNATTNSDWVESRNVSGTYQIGYWDQIEFKWDSTGFTNCAASQYGSTAVSGIATNVYEPEPKATGTYSMMCYTNVSPGGNQRVTIPVYRDQPFSADIYWKIDDGTKWLYTSAFPYPVPDTWHSADGTIDSSEHIHLYWYGNDTYSCEKGIASSSVSARHPFTGYDYGTFTDVGRRTHRGAYYTPPEPPIGGSMYYYMTCTNAVGGTVTNGFTLTREAPPLPACTVNVTPSTVNQGQAATLTWDASNTTSLYIQNVGYVNASGSVAVAPSQTTSYTGTASGEGGSADCTGSSTLTVLQSCPFNDHDITHGQSVTAYKDASLPYGSTCTSQTRTCSNGTLSGSYAYASCSVSALPPAPTASISITPSIVRQAGTALVSWTSNGADSCTVTGGPDSWTGTASPTGGQTTSPIRGEVTYTLRCQNAGGTVAASSTVRVLPEFQES